MDKDDLDAVFSLNSDVSDKDLLNSATQDLFQSNENQRFELISDNEHKKNNKRAAT